MIVLALLGRVDTAADESPRVFGIDLDYLVQVRESFGPLAPELVNGSAVAKGLDVLAAKIKEIAWLHDIPVMENRPLAQALYKGAEVGDPIPAALYHAVAEILVIVYKAQAELRAREAQRRAASYRRVEGVRI